LRHVELVIFENDSIMQEKALSLSIGKVSFRQLAVILSGILGAMIAYFVTKDFMIPGVVLAVFLGLGLVNTKIMSPDQLIRANLLFLIRGTSLSKNRSQKVKPVKDKSKKKIIEKKKEITRQSKLSILSQIISQMESLFVKKQLDNNKTKSKDHAVKIKLTKDNPLKITPTKKATDIDSLQEQITILLDDDKTKEYGITNKYIWVPLEKSLDYDITTMIDQCTGNTVL